MKLNNGDHAFVLIGKSEGGPTIDEGDLKKWGADAVVCDPWAEEAYVATDIPRKMAGMFSSNPFAATSHGRCE